MLLYDSRVSGNCYKVRLLLAHLGQAYERHEVDVVDRSGRAEMLGKLNPALRVPVVVFDDGRALAEFNAILFHLAEGTPWLPEDPFERAKVLQWMFFEQYSHEPHIAVVIFWTNYSRSPPSEPEIAERRTGGYAALDAMETSLASAPSLVGERISIADLALYTYTHMAGKGGFDLDRYPAIGDWLQRVAGEPGHVSITA